ncbi:hypothetical protein C2U70_23880 [Bradyrhizobium guangdongense]|uniref:P-loop ATPase, Sll1717 family n=1 Tax=Bradyrhizobium guangdongense TaxID=1325090 RepID=UPI001125C00A|nr:hypothetical protein [Bradyrhizobium guangdongense]TPQ31541.1 hypothetical protein C2U70_23880 [Bradyrhizobium guangdongense]
MATRQKTFVAYASKDKPLAEGILDAVRKANALQALPVIYEPWPFNDVPGTPLVSPILEKIGESPYLVADITYLNLNVVYEIGYAVGMDKRAFLIRHKGTEGDKLIAKAVGIFDTLGYFEYDTFDELKDRLAAHIDATPLSFSKALDRKSPVYLIEPPDRRQDIGVMVSRIKKAGYGRYRSFTPDEDTRLSATDAIRQVAASSGVFIPMQDPAQDGSEAHNIRCMFIAGLCDGMGKPKLLLAPSTYDVPLDVRDDAKRWHHLSDIHDFVADFCPRIVEYSAQVEPSGIDRTSLLQSMSIGDPRAENEMNTLDRYYLKIDQYDRAINGEVNLVVGRKGSGKTALFISLRDKIRADRRNIVLDLKPEGYQLIRMKEDILEYLSEGARQHLIIAFWEYLIYLEIAYKLLEKDQRAHRYNPDIHDAYRELSGIYNALNFSPEGDFSERLSVLSERLSTRYQEKYGRQDTRRLNAGEVTELVYQHDIRQLREIITNYLRKKEAVWVLFDNLDKGWSTQGVDVIDATILRCLVDAGRKVEREMRKEGNVVHCIVFVRNDVYDHLMRNTPDFGKEMRATLDWNDPDMLREMLRLRLVSGMHTDHSDASFHDIWHELCISHYRGEDTSSYLIRRTLMRPRNLLKIFNHCRGFATNFNRDIISDTDIEKGLKTYSSDLLQELDAELTQVFPSAKDLLYHFMDSKKAMTAAEIEVIFKEAGVDESEHKRLLEFLIYYGVLGVRIKDDEYFIFDVNYDLKVLEIRASRAKGDAFYVVNPAFGPALGISED